jgi:hypothetical protein
MSEQELNTELILEGGPCDGLTYKVCEGVAQVLTATLTVADVLPTCSRVIEYRATGRFRDGKQVFHLYRFNLAPPYDGVL